MEFVRSLRTLHKKYSPCVLASSGGFSGRFVYHLLVLVLVQELLIVSVISFREVMAQHFGSSLILQELSYSEVFHHHCAGTLSAGLMFNLVEFF